MRDDTAVVCVRSRFFSASRTAQSVPYRGGGGGGWGRMGEEGVALAQHHVSAARLGFQYIYL